MQTMLLRVVSSGEMISVKSEKSENGVLNKRILVLQDKASLPFIPVRNVDSLTGFRMKLAVLIHII